MKGERAGFIKAEPFNLGNCLLAFLDSHPLHMDIHTGKMQDDSRTVITKSGKRIEVDSAPNAGSGTKVVTHKIPV